MLLGPLLPYEFLRTARQPRQVLLRCLYGLALCLLLGISVGAGSGREMARFAESFALRFLFMQLCAVVLLTPAYAAGVIAQEKDRKTLDFLLAADLTSREILLGKLTARLAHLGLLLLTGLPILSLTQFWGGVDPNLILAGFAVSGLTLLSLAGLSALNSVYARKPWDAIVLSYVEVAAYYGLSSLGRQLLALPQAKLVLFGGSHAITVADLVNVIHAGDVLAALSNLQAAVDEGKYLADLLPGLLVNYALFHGVTAAVCLTWAAARLRPVAVKQDYSPRRAVRFFRLRPALGESPMLWKEAFVETGFRFGNATRLLLVILGLASFLPAGLILGDWLAELSRTGKLPALTTGEVRRLNHWVRMVGTTVACLMLLGVALRAATSLSGERDRHTLDSLLASPLEGSAIVFGKWLGSLLCVRWGWLWLGLIWALGIATGSLHVLAVPLLLVSWFVHADVAACLGLWFSLVSRTTLRATLGTLLAVLGLWVGHGVLLGMCCLPLLLLGLPAPLTLGILAFCNEDFPPPFEEAFPLGLLMLFGLLYWVIFARDVMASVSTRLKGSFSRAPGPRLTVTYTAPEPPRRRNAILISEERPDDERPAG
jgi:ABC-type transport system involved in multi-copper enzyme maturation permease subunit